jgi:asparagine synthase (glutamine-hydrolysing)
MLLAAPHRGTTVEFHRHGPSVLGIGHQAGHTGSELVHSNGVTVAFTGVLDNLDDLAGAFDLPRGAPFTPGAVVLAGFRILGVRLPARLRGAFAAIISDGAGLMAFRDHVGLAMLFYRDERDRVYIASEVKQVLAGSGLPLEPDPAAVEATFFGAWDGSPPVALRGARRLPGGTTLQADGQEVHIRRYWEPERLIGTRVLSPSDVRSGFECLMTQAVRRTLTGADVVALSGGIDSPAVAAFAAPEHLRIAGRPLSALTAIYPNLPRVDESRYVTQIAEHLQLPLHRYEQRVAPFDRMTEWVRLLDGPVPMISVQETAELYTQARGLGFATMLTGELAESVVDSRRYLVAQLLRQGRLGDVARQLGEQRRRGMALKGIGRQLAAAVTPRALGAAYMRWRPTLRGSRIPDWLDRARVREAAARYVVPAAERWTQEQVVDFTRPDPALEADDICQAVAGITVRRPWADVDLWEFFLSLPAHVKFADPRSKGLVRDSLRDRLPAAIVDRTDKTVFNDVALSRIDYPSLRHWLVKPRQRIAGVDYDVLAQHLAREDFDLVDDNWARDLVAVQAFLAQW